MCGHVKQLVPSCDNTFVRCLLDPGNSRLSARGVPWQVYIRQDMQVHCYQNSYCTYICTYTSIMEKSIIFLCYSGWSLLPLGQKQRKTQRTLDASGQFDMNLYKCHDEGPHDSPKAKSHGFCGILKTKHTTWGAEILYSSTFIYKKIQS